MLWHFNKVFFFSERREFGSISIFVWERNIFTDCQNVHEVTSKCNENIFNGLTNLMLFLLDLNILKKQATSTRFRLSVESYLPVYRFCLKTQKVSPFFACLPHTSGENGQRKLNFSKTLSTVKIFENAVFRVSRGDTWKRNFPKTTTSRQVGFNGHHLKKFCFRWPFWSDKYGRHRQKTEKVVAFFKQNQITWGRVSVFF